MGWTYTYKPSGMSIKEFFTKEFATEHGEVLDVAVCRRNEAYIAYHMKCDDIGNVTAIICALHYMPKDPFMNFGYKDMAEFSGPYLYNCPERILKLLTPTDNKMANQWREKCWEIVNRRKRARQLKNGDIIKLKHPFFSSNGYPLETLKVCRRGNQVLFAGEDKRTGECYRVRIRNWQDFEFDIMPGGKSNATV